MARPRYPGGYPDYIVNHERRAGHRPAGRLARPRWQPKQARARPIPSSSQRYIDNGCHWFHELPDHMKYLPPCQLGLSRLGHVHSASSAADAIVLQLYCEPLQKFRLAAQGHGEVHAAGRAPRAHRHAISIPLPFWYPPLRGGVRSTRELPAACHHPAADGDVSFLGLAECLAAPDPRPQLALHDQRDGRRARLADGDWVQVTSQPRPDQSRRSS